MVFRVSHGLDPYILFNPKLNALVVGVLIINTVAPGISLVFMMRRAYPQRSTTGVSGYYHSSSSCFTSCWPTPSYATRWAAGSPLR